MKQRQLFKSIFTYICLGVLIMSCENDNDPDPKITVTVSTKATIGDAVNPYYLEGLSVNITDTRTAEVTTCTLDENGVSEVMLYKGTYDISIERAFDGYTEEEDCIYSAKKENYSITDEGQKVDLALNIYPASAKNTGFIFSEIFFNGEKNQGWMMHPDQYYVVFNPTQQTLYADGLCIATSAQASIIDKYEFYDKYMPTTVPLTGFVTVPGSGTDHPVKPGEKFVVAVTAIDHSQESTMLDDGTVILFDNAVDLSGADFEIYPDMYKGDKDVDNPDVANLLMTGDLYSHPRGFWSHLIFKLDNGLETTVKQFYDANNTLFKSSDNKERLLILLDSEKISDGMVSGDARPLITRPVPESVDRGYFQVSGCHSSELAIRKEIKIGNKIFYKDTNNSDDDFINKKGQTPYPVGWRN